MMANIKTISTSALAWLSYWTGLVALFYFLNRGAKRIVTFHNVLPDEGFVRNPETGVSHSAGSFRALIRELKKHYMFSTDLFDARTMTITFDDGNLNQYEIASEILREEGEIPAIVFCAGGERPMVEQGLLVDKLCYWVSYAPLELLKDINGGVAISRSRFWRDIMRPRYAADTVTMGEGTYKWADSLCRFSELMKCRSPKYLRLRFQGLTPSMRSDLRSRGWKVGFHTKNHFPLSSLTEAEQLKEMTPPAEMREVVFCYPYGERLSVDESAVSVAERLGYPCAVSDVVSPEPIHGRFFIPRFNMPSYDGRWAKYKLHFELSGLKFFMKYHRLLPRLTYGDD